MHRTMRALLVLSTLAFAGIVCGAEKGWQYQEYIDSMTDSKKLAVMLQEDIAAAVTGSTKEAIDRAKWPTMIAVICAEGQEPGLAITRLGGGTTREQGFAPRSAELMYRFDSESAKIETWQILGQGLFKNSDRANAEFVKKLLYSDILRIRAELTTGRYDATFDLAADRNQLLKLLRACKLQY